jgi:hypothetical protein
MAPKEVTRSEKPKRKVITKWESGTRLSDLAAQYGRAKLTISTILKYKEAIKATNVVERGKTPYQ